MNHETLCVHTLVHIIGRWRSSNGTPPKPTNHAKHGVHFADAVGVFSDDRAMTIEDTSTSEERFKTLGMDFLGRILVVIYTWRGKTIRLISAREATARQRATYEGTRR